MVSQFTNIYRCPHMQYYIPACSLCSMGVGVGCDVQYVVWRQWLQHLNFGVVSLWRLCYRQHWFHCNTKLNIAVHQAFWGLRILILKGYRSLPIGIVLMVLRDVVVLRAKPQKPVLQGQKTSSHKIESMRRSELPSLVPANASRSVGTTSVGR